ncbi:ABC transporter transmembrane domain-containing protein [Brevibacterium oceani]|uniref:ABC transporter transmembrane domain-containing protein n=1 Tax=Brevibacterium oceani TaxID=358099 RepID=UPI0015E71E4F|nr:ABC transporter ATP-binding protein [Brevibacterium oceani]
MSTVRSGDPTGLGRSRLTRWLPVIGQAPDRPPRLENIEIRPGTTPTRLLLGLLLSAKRYTMPAVILGVLWQVGEALVPVVMGAAIDEALAEGDASRLILWIGVLAAVFTVLSLSFRCMAQLAALAAELVGHRLRSTLSRQVLHAPGSAGAKPDGAVVSLMTNDIMRAAALGLAVYPVAEFAGVVFIAVSLLLIHWLLGLVVLVGAPLTVWLMGVLSGRLARDSRVYQTLLAKTVGRATDLVSGYRVIKGMRAESEATDRYRQTSRETLDGAYRNVGLLGRFLVGSTTVSGAFVAAVAALAAWFAIEGEISVGGLIAAVGLSQALLPPMRMLAMNAVPAWAAARGSSERILEALTALGVPASGGAEARGEIGPVPEHDSPSRAAGRVRADTPRLELQFGDREPVRVAPDEIVGLRADEAGAAALAEALLRPESAQALSLTLDGLDRRDPDFDRLWRDTTVISPHHATLFSGTVAETIGSCAADRERALLAAACEDFISGEAAELRQIGEMANRLSGGQRQRLALARAYAAEADLLVLHDPTTAVDSVTEQTIAARLPAIRRGRMTILIASSPVLLSICDRVIDLDDAVDAERVSS